MVEEIIKVGFWMFVAGISFALIILLGFIEPIIFKLKPNFTASRKIKNLVFISMFVLIFLLAMSFWPLAMYFILSFHQWMGTNEAPFISFMSGNRVIIIFVMWGLQFLGALICLPFFIKFLHSKKEI
ncbi:MAG: hypothetical protein ABH824_04445 [Nanoarchaeota archaeon]|nr:hypothetical protein [Nanoarchaeota archaeon]MBU1632631.1 hypothetical protein [Nanoarchaeota archaeon]MBU1876546.1 hypothetical protein [Nanoarchaeota archaeon]